jgi:hypothetical protein
MTLCELAPPAQNSNYERSTAICVRRDCEAAIGTEMSRGSLACSGGNCHEVNRRASSDLIDSCDVPVSATRDPSGYIMQLPYENIERECSVKEGGESLDGLRLGRNADDC